LTSCGLELALPFETLSGDKTSEDGGETEDDKVEVSVAVAVFPFIFGDGENNDEVDDDEDGGLGDDCGDCDGVGGRG